MERIEINENKADLQPNTTYILPRPLTAESIINKALWVIFALLIFVVVSTFFVEDIPNVVVDVRQIAIDGLWLMLCSFTIGELVKQIYRNKGRSTEEYKKAKENADQELASLTTDELSARREYCKKYEQDEYNRCFERLLCTAGLTKDEYKKYAHMDAKELKKRFPELSKMQRVAIDRLNRLKPIHYDTSFFLAGEHLGKRQAPSEMYNVSVALNRNTLQSIFMTAAGGLCAVSFAGEIIFSFSQAALIAAVIKIATILIFGSFKAVFGWNLAMRTEINRYSVIVKECRNLKAFYAAKAKE